MSGRATKPEAIARAAEVMKRAEAHVVWVAAGKARDARARRRKAAKAARRRNRP